LFPDLEKHPSEKKSSYKVEDVIKEENEEYNQKNNTPINKKIPITHSAAFTNALAFSKEKEKDKQIKQIYQKSPNNQLNKTNSYKESEGSNKERSSKINDSINSYSQKSKSKEQTFSKTTSYFKSKTLKPSLSTKNRNTMLSTKSSSSIPFPAKLKKAITIVHKNKIENKSLIPHNLPLSLFQFYKPKYITSKPKKTKTKNLSGNHLASKLVYHQNSQSGQNIQQYSVDVNIKNKKGPRKGTQHSQNSKSIIKPIHSVQTASHVIQVMPLPINTLKHVHLRSKTYYTSPSLIDHMSYQKNLLKKVKQNERQKLKERILGIPISIPRPEYHKKNKTLIQPFTAQMNNTETSTSFNFSRSMETSNSNRKTTFSVLQRLKYDSFCTNTNAINAFNLSKKNLFCILVYRDISTKSFIFRALYEVNLSENSAYRIFSVNFTPVKIYGKEVTKFFSFNSKKGLFYKLSNNIKRFDSDTILMM
ncbi:MAG: hypothetical protein MJ252_30160, partial [archaeon]|nr:hypothetical protein [archaeon]